jgi:hypothetical protein
MKWRPELKEGRKYVISISLMDLMLRASRALDLLHPPSLSLGGIGEVCRGLLREGLPLCWCCIRCMSERELG